MIKTPKILCVCTLLCAVAGCGSRPSDRILSGAGIGAGVGAVGSAVGGGNPLIGAAVGGVAGGAIGGLTKQRDLDLGRPLWR
jgi:osmotically inducible lipoprotein OsmB